ncbi:MAG: putative b-glycosyltransferase, Glycosyltransferase Family 2, partial [Ramlibacter sp.]|nr:putative b-glycosyltransferase, Glycosyltransferase Family 2 [Ramlibacter sp.]
ILPCYNGAATIAVQLEALTRQEWPGGWEVIVVNNGSTDGSMDIVRQYRDRLPSLRIVEAHMPGTPRLGVPHSYNTGINAATGGAFVFCEADDEVAPGWLRAMGEALGKHEFVAARLDHRKLNPEWLHPSKGEGDGYQSAGFAPTDRYPHLTWASGCSMGIRKSVYEQLGPLSTSYPCAHDTEYCWRAQLAGLTLHFVPDALVHYREKADYRARFRQGKSWGRDFARLQKRYGAPAARFALLRQLVWISQCLPPTILAYLWSACRLPNGKSLLGHWAWSMGWSIGRLTALMDHRTESQEGTAVIPTAAER